MHRMMYRLRRLFWPGEAILRWNFAQGKEDGKLALMTRSRESAEEHFDVYYGWIRRWFHRREFKQYKSGWIWGKRGVLHEHARVVAEIPTVKLLPPPRLPAHAARVIHQPTGTLLKSYLASHPRQQVAPDTPIPESEPDTSWLNSPTVVRVKAAPLYVEEPPVRPDDTAKQFTGILKLYYSSKSREEA